jgi:putative ABC transport system substrate-binding protein
VDELVSFGVDVIVTRGAPAAKAAKAATNVPLVMAAIGEPLGVGIVENLARPGGSVTGLTTLVTELAGKRIELLKEAFPTVSRVGFLQNIGNPASPPQWEFAQASARALGLAVELFDVRSAEAIEPAFASMAHRRIDALSVGIDALTQANAARIVALAAERKLPTAYPAREFVELGGLFSYGPYYPDLYFRAAGLIDKILKGARPGDLPVKPPAKFELVINFKTLKTLNLALTPTTLVRADAVIE